MDGSDVGSGRVCMESEQFSARTDLDESSSWQNEGASLVGLTNLLTPARIQSKINILDSQRV